MDALDLFQLGRRLTKLGEEAMRPFGGSPSRPGRRLVLIDALAFPDGMVAKLRDLGILETRADPADRRRTLVKGSGSKPNAVVGFGAVRVDALLVEALGDSPPGSAVELVSALGEIAARLRGAAGRKDTPSAPRQSDRRLPLLRTGPTPDIVTRHGGAGSQASTDQYVSLLSTSMDPIDSIRIDE